MERRKLDRVEVRWPVTMITDKGSIKGEARNITVEGVYIQFNDPIRKPALNEEFSLMIQSPGKIIQVTGKVVWSNLDILPDMGFSFVKISEVHRELLREAIQKHAEK
jgi:hypothetical protein